ncbi:hypothetical protein NA56DRAFT_15287 [Hyaloscypha hepaticicola]|uniref:Uncharacterized protein n=1 Tax=Hyaloscypha hepaticicola TaxID=2082293 RepID=A0A2J6QQC5_9HELO|nr:hypothetical protein NA56DRAFT_15287 [Hyaloscypha hepaticicola]
MFLQLPPISNIKRVLNSRSMFARFAFDLNCPNCSPPRDNTIILPEPSLYFPPIKLQTSPNVYKHPFFPPFPPFLLSSPAVIRAFTPLSHHHTQPSDLSTTRTKWSQPEAIPPLHSTPASPTPRRSVPGPRPDPRNTRRPSRARSSQTWTTTLSTLGPRPRRL